MSNVSSTSTDDYWGPSMPPRAVAPSQIILRFFVLGSVSVAAAGALAWGLGRLLGQHLGEEFHFPAAFAVTTLLLIAGSATMTAARRAVARERQLELRRWLRWAVAIGVAFMGVQTYALWSIVPHERTSHFASTGVAPLVIMLAALHGLHFLVATLFASYVAVQAHAGRYDHEYHWGVTVCTWFWHVLGIVWVAILAVYSIAAW